MSVFTGHMNCIGKNSKFSCTAYTEHFICSSIRCNSYGLWTPTKCNSMLKYRHNLENQIIWQVDITRTLTKSERASPRVCYYNSYFFGDVTLNFVPLTSKWLCKGTFLSPSCSYVWNMKGVRWKLLKLLCQNQSAHKVPLWPWPFDPKMYRYLTLTILHLCMKYQSCTLKTTQVIVLEPKSWQSSVVILTFDLLTPKCIKTSTLLKASWTLTGGTLV